MAAGEDCRDMEPAANEPGEARAEEIQREETHLRRPASIKVAAILLLAVGTVWTGIFLANAYILVARRVLTPSLQNHRFVSFLEAVGFVMIVSAWEVATGIGLLRHRRWARVSIIVLGVMAAYHFLGAALASPFSSYWNFPNGLWVVLLGTSLAFIGFGGLAVMAIVEFSSQRMDRVFYTTGAPASRAPLSALVIGAWLLASGPLELYQILLRSPTIGFPLPVPLFGFQLPARGETVYLILMAAAAVAIGFGLLKGNYWARRGAIAFCIFTIASQLATVLRPESVASILRQMPYVSHAHIALWLEALWALAAPVLAIYFLAAWKFPVPD